jgi:D-tyrosyl-tRNA(Tyr) deacylase
MKAIIQRVKCSSVIVDEKIISEIKNGLLVFLGIEKNDIQNNAIILANKIINLRIFSDSMDKMNLSVKDISGEIMVISQFTLCTDTTKSGNRPSFSNAEFPEKAEQIYKFFIDELKKIYIRDKIKSGLFAAYMNITLINDGPVTILLEK